MDIGDKKGRLTLLIPIQTTKGHKKGLFVCECGTEKQIRISSVISGNTRSCGCLIDYHKLGTMGKTHGMTKSPEWRSWDSMISRCLRKEEYKHIEICNSWKTFENFLNDMGRKPSKKHTIDRINNSKGYYPENCRWATPKEQANNRINNRVINCYGVSLTVSEWSDVLEIPQPKIRRRLRKDISEHDALFSPHNCQFKTIKKYNEIKRLFGLGWAKDNIAEWMNVDRKTVYNALNYSL